MSDTQQLMQKIAALRERLERARGTTDEIGSAVAQLTGEAYEKENGDSPSWEELSQQVRSATELDREVDTTLETLVQHVQPVEMPTKLTARARLILERGRDLLAQLRGMEDEIASVDPEDSTKVQNPLSALYRQLISLTSTAIRVITTLPDTATSQLPLCDGPEVILDGVTARLSTLRACVHRQTEEEKKIAQLSGLLLGTEQGSVRTLESFWEFASLLVQEAETEPGLRWNWTSSGDQVKHIACHSLNVARIVARMARRHGEFRHRENEPVLAALIHDIGMLRVPAEILGAEQNLTDEQKRIVETHCRVGAELVLPLEPAAEWLHQAVLTHHERLDGTGYPDGLRDYQLSTVARLLAVCDSYAALCSPRPYRSAQDTRSALTDTLLMAEQGFLDQMCAELLLNLSFYPVGSVVELADGSVGVVTATPSVRPEPVNPARPVVALLFDSEGVACATPRHLDLAQQEGYSILRTLSRDERIDRLHETYPEWVA